MRQHRVEGGERRVSNFPLPGFPPHRPGLNPGHFSLEGEGELVRHPHSCHPGRRAGPDPAGDPGPRGVLSGPAGVCGQCLRQSWVPDLRPDRCASGLSSGMTRGERVARLSRRCTSPPVEKEDLACDLHRRRPTAPPFRPARLPHCPGLLPGNAWPSPGVWVWAGPDAGPSRRNG